MSRYVKQVMVFICTLVIVAGSICSFSFESNAAGDIYYLDYAEPATSEAQGYVAVAIQNDSTSEISIFTFFWNSYAVDGGLESPAEMLLTFTKTTVNFNVQQYGATGVWYTVGAVTTVGNYRIYAHSSSSDYTYNFGAEGFTIVGWKLKGNGSASGFWNSYDFSVFFSDDGEAILLQEIINLLISSNSIDRSILSTVTSILNSVDGVESQLSSVVSYLSSVSSKLTTIQTQLNSLITRADELLAAQQESNSWLEKIYNKIVEALGMEGEESTEPLPDEDISSTLEAEDSLTQDTTEAEGNLSFSIDSNSNSVVWNIIERVLNANSKVFGAFIGIMTLGIVTLLLNR